MLFTRTRIMPLKWPLSSPERASSSYSECLLINNHPDFSQDSRELKASSICSPLEEKAKTKKMRLNLKLHINTLDKSMEDVVLYHLQCKSLE